MPARNFIKPLARKPPICLTILENEYAKRSQIDEQKRGDTEAVGRSVRQAKRGGMVSGSMGSPLNQSNHNKKSIMKAVKAFGDFT